MSDILNEEIFSSTLYVVPTPIGNLYDITYRAVYILRNVNLIASEDTRRTSILLKFFSITTPLFSFHEYNEKKNVGGLLAKLHMGNAIALVSDAGTPLLNDPGYCLVRACCSYGIRVIPLPGPCAAITALSASGLPSHRFCVEGFVPVKRQARINYIRTLSQEMRTLIFYVSKYRILNVLEDMVGIFGMQRRAVIARELTKVWESIYRGSLHELLTWVRDNSSCVRGEIVVIIEGYDIQKNKLDSKIEHAIKLLVKELPFKTVVDLIVKIYGVNRNIVYNYLLNRRV